MITIYFIVTAIIFIALVIGNLKYGIDVERFSFNCFTALVWPLMLAFLMFITFTIVYLWFVQR